jgi:hypothetical protein
VVAEILETLKKRQSQSAQKTVEETAEPGPADPGRETGVGAEPSIQAPHIQAPTIQAPPDPHPTEVADSACYLLEDFYAFGYAVMQVQVMARKLRYSFNLDWMIVADQILNAARSSIAGNREDTDRWLAAAFDSISQERDRYCSQQGNVLELVLTATSTVGASLSNQLQVDRPITLYATTKTLQRCRETNPNAWSHLVQRIADGTMSLAGGLRDEGMHSYLTEAGLVRAFQDGVHDYTALGLEPPKTWMRFQSGITGNLPTIARQFGYVGAIIASFNGGTIPEKDHAKVRWQTHNESPAIDCILGHVLDAADAESILALGAEMAKQLDYHQVPTMVLAHWPSQKNAAFDDLARAMMRTPAIGKWIDATKYFATTAQPYWTDNYGSKDFRSPLPSDASHLNALHLRLVEYTARIHRLERLAAANRLWDWVPKTKGGTTSNAASNGDLAAIDAEIQQLLRDCDERVGAPNASSREPAIDTASSGLADGGLADGGLAEIDQRIDALQSRVFASIRSRIPGSREFVVINPTSHPQRVFLSNLPTEVDVASSTRIIAADATVIQASDPTRAQGAGVSMDAIIDVPPYGFAKWRTNTNFFQDRLVFEGLRWAFGNRTERWDLGQRVHGIADRPGSRSFAIDVCCQQARESVEWDGSHRPASAGSEPQARGCQFLATRERHVAYRRELEGSGNHRGSRDHSLSIGHQLCRYQLCRHRFCGHRFCRCSYCSNLADYNPLHALDGSALGRRGNPLRCDRSASLLPCLADGMGERGRDGGQLAKWDAEQVGDAAPRDHRSDRDR